jgi:hypothetical protein
MEQRASTPTDSAQQPAQKDSKDIGLQGLSGNFAANPATPVQSGIAHHSVPCKNLGATSLRKCGKGTVSALLCFFGGGPAESAANP